MQHDGNHLLPLHLAVSSKASLRVVELLCSIAPATLHMVDLDARLALHRAVVYGAPVSVVQCLLKFCREAVHAKDLRGLFPIQLAVLYGAPRGVIYELASVDHRVLSQKDGQGRNLLELAAARGAKPWILDELGLVLPKVTGINLLHLDKSTQTRAMISLLRSSGDFKIAGEPRFKRRARSAPAAANADPPKKSVHTPHLHGGKRRGSPVDSDAPELPHFGVDGNVVRSQNSLFGRKQSSSIFA